MGVKIFCNQCQEYIKDATPGDFSRLTGEEVCEECETRNKRAFKEIDSILAEGRLAFQKLGDKYKVKLDETFRKVMRK